MTGRRTPRHALAFLAQALARLYLSKQAMLTELDLSVSSRPTNVYSTFLLWLINGYKDTHYRSRDCRDLLNWFWKNSLFFGFFSHSKPLNLAIDSSLCNFCKFLRPYLFILKLSEIGSDSLWCVSDRPEQTHVNQSNANFQSGSGIVQLL